MARMDAFRTDPHKCVDGVWKRFKEAANEDEKPLDFRIASMRSKEFRAHAARLTRPHNRRLQLMDPDSAANASDDEWRSIVAPAIAKHVVKDWRGIEELDPKSGELIDVPYSCEQLIAWLRDDDLKEFSDWVFITAGVDDVFRADVLEKAKGECGAPSDGGSNSDGASS